MRSRWNLRKSIWTIMVPIWWRRKAWALSIDSRNGAIFHIIMRGRFVNWIHFYVENTQWNTSSNVWAHIMIHMEKLMKGYIFSLTFLTIISTCAAVAREQKKAENLEWVLFDFTIKPMIQGQFVIRLSRNFVSVLMTHCSRI